MFHLIYRLLYHDIVYLFKKSREAVSDIFDFMFKRHLYIILKKAVMVYAFGNGNKVVPIEEFNKEIVKQFNILKKFDNKL